MRPKVLEENIDNFNAVTKDTLEHFAKLKEASGLGEEIPDLEGELSKWATESKFACLKLGWLFYLLTDVLKGWQNHEC